jgi:hypothetical protein
MSNNTIAEESLEIKFNSALFANRKKEKQLFLETVHAAAQHTYLEFNGVAGQGKSELLKWIYHNAKKEGYLASYIDFEIQEYYRPEIYPILRTIGSHLSTQISKDYFQVFTKNISPYLRELQRVYRESYESEKPESVDRRPLKKLEDLLIQTFNDSLNTILKSNKVVVCLDSTERVYRPALRSFEEQILTHHTKHRNFMLVTAGQEELVWKNTKIRNIVKRHDLSRFDSESLHDQVQRLAAKKGFRIEDDTVVLNKMLELTLGHPFSTYKLVDFWTNGFTESLNKLVVEERFVQSIRELLEKVIEERILGKFQLSEEYPPVKQTLWYLAPLRHIELSMFRYVLSNFLEDRFKSKSFLFYEKLIGEFQNSYIFTQWRLGSGFNLEPVVRNVLLWDMRTNARDYFIKMQKNLEEQYDIWVKQTRDATQVKNIVERLYHYATYLKETQPTNVSSFIQIELQHYLDTYFTQEFTGSEETLQDQLNRLYNALEYDQELAELLDISELLETIKDHKEKMK